MLKEIFTLNALMESKNRENPPPGKKLRLARSNPGIPWKAVKEQNACLQMLHSEETKPYNKRRNVHVEGPKQTEQ